MVNNTAMLSEWEVRKQLHIERPVSHVPDTSGWNVGWNHKQKAESQFKKRHKTLKQFNSEYKTAR